MYEWHLADRILKIEQRPLIMGIVNVTPDSFSDGGRFSTTQAAMAHALSLVQQGADILDIGGESTRPGAEPVPLEEELKRVLPVVQGLAGRTEIPIAVDTSKAEVAEAVLKAGARIINDVTALTGDPDMAKVARTTGAGVLLMHMHGSPQTMQLNPQYEDVVRDIGQFFEGRLNSLADDGIAAERTVLDPGIGFGKTRDHNLEILARLKELQCFSRPICLGVSRKGFLGRLLGDRPVHKRLASSLAAVGYALAQGAVQIVRVHDVEETRDAIIVFTAIQKWERN